MTSRPRTTIGTYGTIHVKRVGKRRYRARTRVRDADGRLREVKVTSGSGNQAKALLRRTGQADIALLAHLSMQGWSGRRLRTPTNHARKHPLNSTYIKVGVRSWEGMGMFPRF